MRLVNYYRGNNTLFDCVIHGTIYMTTMEWMKAFKHIEKNKKQLDPYGGYFRWEMFLEDTKRRITWRGKQFINIRVDATKMIVYEFNLSNYKQGNYQLCIQ